MPLTHPHPSKQIYPSGLQLENFSGSVYRTYFNNTDPQHCSLTPKCFGNYLFTTYIWLSFDLIF